MAWDDDMMETSSQASVVCEQFCEGLHDGIDWIRKRTVAILLEKEPTTKERCVMVHAWNNGVARKKMRIEAQYTKGRPMESYEPKLVPSSSLVASSVAVATATNVASSTTATATASFQAPQSRHGSSLNRQHHHHLIRGLRRGAAENGGQGEEAVGGRERTGHVGPPTTGFQAPNTPVVSLRHHRSRNRALLDGLSPIAEETVEEAMMSPIESVSTSVHQRYYCHGDELGDIVGDDMDGDADLVMTPLESRDDDDDDQNDTMEYSPSHWHTKQQLMEEAYDQTPGMAATRYEVWMRKTEESPDYYSFPRSKKGHQKHHHYNAHPRPEVDGRSSARNTMFSHSSDRAFDVLSLWKTNLQQQFTLK